MGKIRDWCLATGLEETKYRAQDFKVSSGAMKGTAHRLPSPYHKQDFDPLTRTLTEREIQKLGLAAMGLCFPFYTRLEGAGKLVTLKSGEGKLIGSSMSGLPDSIGVKGGRLYGIEFKRPGGHVSVIQYAKLLELHKAGARVCICCNPSKIREWVDIGTYSCRIADWLEVL
jgi:hypothetical protein